MLVYVRACAVFTVTHTILKTLSKLIEFFIIVCSINFDKNPVTTVS